MIPQGVLKLLCNGPVIPAVRNPDDFRLAMDSPSPGVILLFGDINTLPGLLEQAKQHKKRLVIHLDLVEGIGRDKAGIKFLGRMGVTALITTKSHLAKIAREESMIVIQRLFLMDSEALKSGVQLLRGFKPDALEVLPGSIPAAAVQELSRTTGVPILAGGLMTTPADIQQAIANGICAVSTSRRELWSITI